MEGPRAKEQARLDVRRGREAKVSEIENAGDSDEGWGGEESGKRGLRDRGPHVGF